MSKYADPNLRRELVLVAVILLFLGTLGLANAILGARKASGVAAILTQRSYRFQNDDGTNVNSNTNQVPADASRSNVKKGERINIRIQVDNTGDGTANKELKLQYDKYDANWIDVGPSAEIRPSYGLSGAEGDIITSAVCSPNAKPWKDGTWHENTNLTGLYVFKELSYTEFGFMVETSAAAQNKTYRFRLFNNTNKWPLDAYSIYPTITIVGSTEDILRHSKEDSLFLAPNADDLTYYLDDRGYRDVQVDDQITDEITSANYPVFLFKAKNTNNTENINITWNGQSSVATSASPVYLEMYNYSTSSWTQVASNNGTAADTDFTMAYTESTNASNYYDASNWVVVRVYQAPGTQTLRTDEISIVFTSPWVDPHTGFLYLLETDICAKCHRTHTGVAEHLNIPLYMKDQCFTCHNGTGSIYNSEAEFARICHHTLGGQDSGSTKQCSSCHEAHLLNLPTARRLVDPRDARVSWDIIDDLTSPNYDNLTPPSGIYLWCERCHSDSQAEPVGTTILTVEFTETRYIPYNVQIIWKTSRQAVDESGDTTGYWQYFTVNTVPAPPPTPPRYGYNDATAIGHSAHGKAALSDYARTKITVWKGPYGPDFKALPCTVCHDNHGSGKPWLIVDTITVGGVPTTGYDLATADGQRSFCEACHVGTYEQCNLAQKCTNCHHHGLRF